MPKLMKRITYARGDLTGDLEFVEHKVELNQWERKQDCIYCTGTIHIQTSPDESIKYIGDVVITRAALINQIVRQLGDDTDKWKGKIFTFDDGTLTAIRDKETSK